MSKQSIRNEIEKITEKSEAILSNKELQPEVRLFIESMLSIMKIIVAVLLEKRIRKNSSNSGLPPSSNPGGNGNRNKGKPGTKKNVGSHLDNSKIEKREETLSPEECGGCGTDLGNAEVTNEEKRTTLDIEYTVVETTLTAETRKCSDCGDETKAKFPEGVNARFQYGIGIKSAIVNFLMIQMMSLQRVAEHLKGLTGRLISEATMLKYVINLGEILKKDWVEKVKKELLEAPVLYVDETSMRVNKLNYWIHTCSYGDIVLQVIHWKRGVDGINSMGILDKYGGIIVHDCWSSYLAYGNLRHALCIAHLMRELKFIEESTGGIWATKMKKLLKAAVNMVGSRKGKNLTKKEIDKLEKIYDDILMLALFELPDFPAPTGKRGRPKHTDAQNLWMRLYDYKDSVLLFTKVAEVEPTNNRAERDLRMNKVKKKVSGCFRTYEIARHFCMIYSYVKTMRNKGYSSLQAITLAFKREIPC